MSLLCWCVVLCALAAVPGACGSPSPSVASSDEAYETKLEMELYALANRERAKRGVPALKWNSALVRSARNHTDLLARYGLLSHRFRGEPTLVERIASTGLRFNASAENVALAADFDDLHRGWMQSEGHRANLLNARYNAIGIGIVKANGRYYATQNFARTTEDLTAQDAEERVAKLFNERRRRFSLPSVEFTNNAGIRSAMCGMARRDRLEAARVPAAKGARGTIAFTAHDFTELPQPLEKYLQRQEVARIAIGACFMVTPEYPGGAYWFGAAL
jgi:uncharacterized protein YkwD